MLLRDEHSGYLQRPSNDWIFFEGIKRNVYAESALRSTVSGAPCHIYMANCAVKSRHLDAMTDPATTVVKEILRMMIHKKLVIMVIGKRNLFYDIAVVVDSNRNVIHDMYLVTQCRRLVLSHIEDTYNNFYCNIATES